MARRRTSCSSSTPSTGGGSGACSPRAPPPSPRTQPAPPHSPPPTPPSTPPPPLVARRSPAGSSPRLGQLHLQLRAVRGAQLPVEQRAVLARCLPRRRAARGRGGLDALPRLLAEGRRVDPERPRRPREPRGH